PPSRAPCPWGGRVGQPPADRAPVRDSRVGDLPGRLSHHRIARGQQARPLGRLVAEQRTDPKRRIALVEKIETLDPVDVNQVSGTGKPQLEHWDKALSTGQHLAFIAELI